MVYSLLSMPHLITSGSYIIKNLRCVREESNPLDIVQ